MLGWVEWIVNGFCSWDVGFVKMDGIVWINNCK